MTDEEKKPRYNPAKENMWYEFMQATIALDNNPEDTKPRGYHWFWGLYFIKDKLPDFDLTEIKKELLNEHWLKEAQIPSLSKELDDLTQKLIKGREHTFEGRKFIQEIDKINFEGLDFQGYNTTTALDFEKTGDFSEFIFPIKISFDRSRFFPSKFSKAIFFNSVSFISVEFCGQTLFKNTVFLKKADFMITKFHGGANFRKAIFVKDAYFDNSVFSGSAFFYQVIFAGSSTSFSNTTFSSNALFSGVNFFGTTYFNNAKFVIYTNFKLSTFDKHAPRFYGATFNSEMVWTDINLPKFKKINDKVDKIEYDEGIKRNQDAYENIATKLENQKKYHDQHFFFREEMRCRRRLAENFLSRWAYGVYENVSDYGYGVGRALSWWFGHVFIGAIALFGFRYFYGINDFINDAGCALGVSLANSHGFFFMGNRLNNCYLVFEDLPFFTAIWATQTVFGIALLFLVLLTLRVRFRLK